MKKLFVLSFIAITALLFASCDKVEQLLFQPFESPLNFEVTIPAIANTTSEAAMGGTNVSYNLEDEIRKNTENHFGAGIVGAMYISNVAITLLESENDNSLNNFEYIKLNVSNGTNSAAFGPFNVPAGSLMAVTFPVSNSANIKPYFSGTSVNFNMTGKLKKATTRSLRARVSATIKFEK